MMKIGIVCSAGGHLVQSLICLDAFKNHDIFLVTYNSPTLVNFQNGNISLIYFIKYLGDNLCEVFLALFIALFTFIKIFLKERPDVIFSTGSEIALPAFLVAKFLFRAKLIYLESLTRVSAPSLTGKILYYVSDLFLVQSELLLEKFGRRAKFKGSLL